MICPHGFFNLFSLHGCFSQKQTGGSLRQVDEDSAADSRAMTGGRMLSEDRSSQKNNSSNPSGQGDCHLIPHSVPKHSVSKALSLSTHPY